ncbi:MAG: amino acid ABC transporter permease [Actinomyces sp.]|nr:MAG: amino acid ABC transporter permease [Actinomyces sp.]
MSDAYVTTPDAVEARARPREPHLSPRQWIHENLFSSVGSGVLTVVFGLLVLVFVRGMLGFVFSPERQWDAAATNLQLLMVQAYPDAQFTRVWVSVGTLLALTGLSVAAWGAAPRFAWRRLASVAISVGVAVIGVGLLAPFSGGARLAYIGVGAVPVAIGLLGLRRFGPHDERDVDGLGVLAALGAAVIVALWVVPFGRHHFVNGEVIAEPGTIAFTTKLPLTVLFGVLLVAHRVGVVLRARVRALRPILLGLWLLSPFVLTFIVLRDPAFDYGHVWTTDLPIYAAYAVGGGLLLWWLTRPGVGEIGRIVAALVLVAALASFLQPMRMIVRLDALLLALFALAAPTFAGAREARLRYVGAWVGLLAVFSWLVTAVNTPSTVQLPTGTFFFGGLGVTLMIAVYTILFSFPFGLVLALARTSRMPIFRVMATTYIEVIRGVPLITVLIFFDIILPLVLPPGMDIARVASIVMGYSLFSAAYLAENVRGGLQSIRRGQHEAAEALGMSTAQKTVFIVLPQALRVSIPPLVGQFIATYKETSLVAIIGLFDLLYIARTVIPGSTAFQGSSRENLLVVSMIYWVGAYALSRASQRVERKLGLGER